MPNQTYGLHLVRLPSLADELDMFLPPRETERFLEPVYETDEPREGQLRCCCGAPKSPRKEFCSDHFTDPYNAHFWVGVTRVNEVKA